MTVTKIDYIEREAPRELPENATATEALPPADVEREIARVVRESEGLAEDLAIAVVVRTRMEADTGERMPLAEFIRQEGFDPADFGVE